MAIKAQYAPRHGTTYRYRLGCRCRRCCKAKALEAVKYLARKKAKQKLLLISSKKVDVTGDVSVASLLPAAPRETVKGYTRRAKGTKPKEEPKPKEPKPPKPKKPKKPRKQRPFQDWGYKCPTCHRYSRSKIKGPDGKWALPVKLSDVEPLESGIAREQMPRITKSLSGKSEAQIAYQEAHTMPQVCVQHGNPWPCSTCSPRPVTRSLLVQCPACGAQGFNIYGPGETPSPHQMSKDGASCRGY